MNLDIFNIMVNTIKRILSGVKARPIPPEIVLRAAISNKEYKLLEEIDKNSEIHNNELLNKFSTLFGYSITLDESHYIYIVDCDDNSLFSTITLFNGNVVYIVGSSLFNDIRVGNDFYKTYSLLDLCYKLAIVYYNGYRYPWVSKEKYGLYTRKVVCDNLEALTPAALFLVSTGNTDLNIEDDNYFLKIITGYNNPELDNYNKDLDEYITNLVTCIHKSKTVYPYFRALLNYDNWVLHSLFM